MTAGEAVVAVFKDKSYWKGVAKKAILPPLKALVDATENKIDDTVYTAVELVIDTVLPDDVA